MIEWIAKSVNCCMIFYTYSVHSFRREYSFLLLKFLFFKEEGNLFAGVLSGYSVSEEIPPADWFYRYAVPRQQNSRMSA